jgi:hypothetical protein
VHIQSKLRSPNDAAKNAVDKIEHIPLHVVPGLVPGIHVAAAEDVDGRDKPGNDEREF